MGDSEKEYIVLDCDIGTDDAWALLTLIKAEQEMPDKYKILGVTCIAGNSTIDNIAINTLRILDSVNRLDIPVYKGCHEAILPKRENKEEKPDNKYFHGKDGLGDLKHEKSVNLDIIQKPHAVNAMFDFVCKHPKKVTFILVGPLTNFALCINMYPDFTDKVKSIFIMGGNIQAVGNATSSAEFNFYMDPEAAHIVLEKSKCPITILPLEACLENKFQIPMDWRIEKFQVYKNDAIRILNECEIKLYVRKNFKYWYPCDALLTAVFLFPERIIKQKSIWRATVELNGSYTRGQMILDHLKLGNNTVNVRIIEEICAESFKEIALWAADL
ncbi:nucleoside hydrolase-like [Condylostylus longicornis]|uniref:nucleoside hydrolase-like n=1 Tax=Condylostylus longicornis TaxID=2530218 RepID=UPI00244E3E5F|nr:nucleoside hydrolase-like [Condylostylus longicornis]XP_055380643.1 nucleoside hydrolase-like [Condylostylus longicornis]